MSNYEDETTTSVDIFENLKCEFEHILSQMSSTKSYLEKTTNEDPITTAILNRYEARLADSSKAIDANRVLHSEGDLNISHPELLPKHEEKDNCTEDILGLSILAESNLDCTAQNDDFHQAAEKDEEISKVETSGFSYEDQACGSSDSYSSKVDSENQKQLTYSTETETDNNQVCCANTKEKDIKLNAAVGYFLQAKSDENCAVQLSKLEFYGQAAFFLQQSAEKCLKAILIHEHGSWANKWGKSHDLSLLARCVLKQLNNQDPCLHNACKSLDKIGTVHLKHSLLSIKARYPQPDKMKIVDTRTFPCLSFKKNDINRGLAFLEKISTFTRRYFEAQMKPNGKDVLEKLIKNYQAIA
jgi:hypothetical protein